MDDPLYDELSLLHFNDVYHITQSTALGRLSHIFRKAKDFPEADRPITVFSGDAFSPSLESAVMKGKHMVPILNHLLVDVACYGNHDVDFGEDVLVDLSLGCTFPWLLANAVHADGRLLATAKEYLVLEKKGYRIGFFGLAGTDWPSNCQHLPDDCAILDPVSVAHRVAGTLRATHRADIIIVLTHMRHEEDVQLAQQCDADVDLILGGHDHGVVVYGPSVSMTADDVHEGHVKLVKSGTDFKSFSEIKMHLVRTVAGAVVRHVRVTQTRDITSVAHLPDDRGMHAILTTLQTRLADTVDKPLFYSAVPLDGRTDVVRTRETNLGNMLADAIRAYYHADIALVNSGSVRCDRVIPAGVITVKDMIDVLPFDNPFVVKRIRGSVLLAALENATCDIVDGRFLQVSGLSFRIDPCRPVGARVGDVSLVGHRTASPRAASSTPAGGVSDPDPKVPAGTRPTSASALMNAEGEYTVAMVAFLADGFDGYTVFRGTPSVVRVEGAVTDSSLFLQLFRRVTHDDHGAAAQGPIDRARDAIILGRAAGGLPLVCPAVQGRISHV